MIFRGIDFDDVLNDSNGQYWSQVCSTCLEKHKELRKYRKQGASGRCGIKGCLNEAIVYIDFPKTIKEEIE